MSYISITILCIWHDYPLLLDIIHIAIIFIPQYVGNKSTFPKHVLGWNLAAGKEISVQFMARATLTDLASISVHRANHGIRADDHRGRRMHGSRVFTRDLRLTTNARRASLLENIDAARSLARVARPPVQIKSMFDCLTQGKMSDMEPTPRREKYPRASLPGLGAKRATDVSHRGEMQGLRLIQAAAIVEPY